MRPDGCWNDEDFIKSFYTVCMKSNSAWAPSLPPTLPPTNEWICYQDACYHRSTTTMAWIDAISYCDDMESTIVSIQSQSQNQFIASYICSDDCFIGLTDSGIEGEFEWVDG